MKSFVLERRKLSPAEHAGQPPLSMVNDFPAADRAFINRLAEDLHLSVAWDEYDDQDRNLVTWRFPGELEEPVPENGDGKPEEEDGDDEEWEDDDDEEERSENGEGSQKGESKDRPRDNECVSLSSCLQFW